MPLTQANREIAVETPLGTDVLLLRSVSIQEQLGRLFQMEADLISTNDKIAFDDIVGQNPADGHLQRALLMDGRQQQALVRLVRHDGRHSGGPATPDTFTRIQQQFAHHRFGGCAMARVALRCQDRPNHLFEKFQTVAGLGEQRQGQQRCADCNTWCHRVGPGGVCPCCDEPVALADVVTPDQLAQPASLKPNGRR